MESCAMLAMSPLVVIFLLFDSFADGATSNHGADETVNKTEATVVLVVCALICMAAVLFDAVYTVTTARIYKIYNTPNKEVLDFLNDKANVMDKTQIQARVRDVLALGLEHADKMAVNTFLKSISDAGVGCVTETVDGARDRGLLRIRKDNRLILPGQKSSTLHINELLDLYGNPMFLSAAPLRDQFEDHWEAIWERNIGVVVWIGRFITHEVRMESYIDLKTKKDVKHGKFRVKTVDSADIQYKFSIYYVHVLRERVQREIVIVHGYEWLQESVSWALQRDVEFMNCIKEEHMRRMRAAGLRGVMFQCKLGTAGSASVLAAYLGFQTWMMQKRVNMLAILRYIRQKRAMAFEQTGDPHQPFLVQVQVAYAVMYALSKLCDTKKSQKYEPWIRELLGKVEEPVKFPAEMKG